MYYLFAASVFLFRAIAYANGTIVGGDGGGGFDTGGSNAGAITGGGSGGNGFNGIIVPSAGGNIDTVIERIISLLVNSIVPVCVAIFLYGVLVYTFSVIHEESRSKGKSIMIGALIGVALGSGAEAILNFVLYILFN
jgi:hypothetical protein